MTVDTSKTADSVHDLANNAEDVLRSLGADADDQLSDLRNRLRSTLSDVRDRLSRLQDDATGATKRAAANVDGYVRERPWTAVAAGLLVGLLAGALLTRSSRDDDE